MDGKIKIFISSLLSKCLLQSNFTFNLILNHKWGNYFLDLLSLDVVTISLICWTSHWTPSCSPSPVNALLELMCHGLSLIFSSPKADWVFMANEKLMLWVKCIPAAIFTLDNASGLSILLANSKIGTFRSCISGWCSKVSNSSFTTTGRLVSNMRRSPERKWSNM